MSYVYFFKTNSNPALFKIGVTHQLPNKRLKALQTGCPYPLEHYSRIEHDDPRRVESEIHKRLCNYRLEGEWFQAPVEVIDSLLLEYGIDTTPNFVEYELDSGLKCFLRLSDNEIFLPIKIFSRLQQIAFFATTETLHFDSGGPYVSLNEIEKDYPELKNHFMQFRRRLETRAGWCNKCSSTKVIITFADKWLANCLCSNCALAWTIPIAGPDGTL